MKSCIITCKYLLEKVIPKEDPLYEPIKRFVNSKFLECPREVHNNWDDAVEIINKYVDPKNILPWQEEMRRICLVAMDAGWKE